MDGRDLASVAGDEAQHAAELLELGEPFLELDREWRIVRVNRGQERLSGKPRAETLGRVFWEVWPETASPGTLYWREYHRCMDERTPVHFQEFYAPLDIWTEVTAYPTTAGIAVFFRDITDRRRAEAQYRTLAENAPEVIARFDRELRHTYLNEYGARVYGIPAAEVVGKTNADLGMPAEKVAFWKRHFEEVFATGEQRTVDFDFDSPTFGKQFFSSLFVPERDDTGAVASVLAITRDVTDERRAQEALREGEERYRTLFTNMTEGFALGEAILDDTGAPCDFRLLEMNEAFERQSGLDRERARGRPIREVLPHIEQFWIDTYGDVALGGPPRRFESYNRDVDRCFGVYCFSPARGRFAVLFTDITERKRAEEALRDANERLREADRRKDEFLGMLSHELRNPLAPIRNALYILDRSDPGGDQARRAKEVANRQVAHITRLVDDLLDVTRIARGKIELRCADLDLAGLARRTADDYRALMQERGLELVVQASDRPLPVYGDETRLAQVLGNLLSNAAKFTPAGGRVTLTVRAEDGRAVAHVRDTGPGVATEVLPTLFAPFTQAKQTLARSEGGLGLGLALVKGLVTLHGGEVAVETGGGGEGADFVVRLPLAARAEARPSERGRPGPPIATPHYRVLVVDDNKDAAETLAQLVEMLGHDAAVAYDGPSALAIARERSPDLVLCDIGLPGMDGYEVARRLRADGARDVRLVALSGYAQPEDVTRAIEAGFDAHVAKPPDPERLSGLLDEIA